MKLRADEEQEVQGLDVTEHGERGYAYQDFMAGSPIFHSTISAEKSLSTSKVGLNA